MTTSVHKVPLPPCPACGGDWLYSLTFQHRTSCRLYEPDSATTYSDYQNKKGIRPLTTTEKELIADEYQQPEHPEALGIRYRHWGIHLREVVILDADGRYARRAERRTDA